MLFRVNENNLKSLSCEQLKQKGINIVIKNNVKSYKKGKVLNIKISGQKEENSYSLDFMILASKELLNSLSETTYTKINEYIDKDVIIGINNVLDSSGLKYSNFYLQKIQKDFFKLNIYIKDYEFLSPRYNMFIEFFVDYNEN